MTLTPPRQTGSPTSARTNAETLPSRSPGVRCFQSAVEFPAALEAIPPARRELHTLLCKSGLAGIADIVALAAEELMANAVAHGCHGLAPDTTVDMAITCDGRQVTLKVEDPSSDLPCVLPGTSDEEGGRGMLLVDAFTDRWGVEKPSTGGAGKAVWMELACSPAEGAEAS
ncbi:ATP-binding protein [Streptomyces sp. NPDC001165]|uniref:ATP-binding protein n=1 Tax=Streptomyces sp. NPDC001165 TaxID=3364546 RepID=UPI0036B72CA1